ncbi:isopenicillin N synthase family oxygenase [Oceanihabitans sediminis]|uniref:Isopenicillin N synthase family oxygenase n=1 Tax=Oceanihabitans sediminis TaxID=1812012 RepID=A0A368P3G8_9FLAO|nr:2-oxoglutarate and iron-dependent oxygenase domain-containing protein [Oceanihabitans sediminis]MDX1277256.1 2-oxoglutarate and iron-dependent oxygenase domain-containing protein [Oceanihabitans sediminis]MDX1773675.1 2-oxoglutarate and iron-dependent oxygenase domain-containing protein [Oceanihabitans sediminis]RBP33119.1 isopenicillin N synthase-like dioxygenase [Oceanihabitans sediminis]RCU57372.1 isopenicillin N synthase family oxygenase [Oceanihabitans sediminis]
MDRIPSVNLSDFVSGDPKRKQKFVDEIGKAYEEIGFVALKGHFLDDTLVDNLYSEVKNFFDLPLETKQKYEIEGIGGQRGYISFGKESAKGKKEGDLKEFWHFGQWVENNPKLEEEYPENVTVEELPEFNRIGKETYRMLEKTAKYVLRALALHLNLEETYFDNYIHNGNSILRPIHYPPIVNEPKNAVRAAAHGDINLITLLMGAQGRGLQVQRHDGEWIDAIAEPDELMINVGDMLSRHTNNKLKSTIHRVINPPRELWGTSRYSIPFFMHPVSDMKLNVLESCIDKENPKQFDDITAGEFLHERLVDLGLIKK